MRTTRGRQKSTPVHRVFAAFLCAILSFYCVFVPLGERRFDIDGSVCVAADMGCCHIETDTHCPDSFPTYQASDAASLTDSDCSDCRYVSWNAHCNSAGESVNPARLFFLATAEPTVFVLPDALAAMPRPCANAPPNGVKRFLPMIRSPRPPPVS